MGVIIDGFYLGNKKAKLVHEPSGSELIAAAPRDNAGDGSSFSPTDLVAGALGACLMIIMGILADRSGLDLSGMKMRVVKEMRNDPRRIASLSVLLHLPQRLSPDERLKLERAARTCPVLQSLHPDVAVTPQFVYDA
jgi:uncharacterized OsmC-like protein